MTSRPRSARASARNCSRHSFSCNARIPTSRCGGSRAASCGRRARRSATISRCSGTPRWRRETGATIAGSRPSDGAPRGVRAAPTRIHAIASRRRIGPSARGRRRTRRRNAIATSQASRRRSRAGNGATNPSVPRAATGRGRSPVRRETASPGRTNRAVIDPGAASLQAVNRSRGATSPLVVHRAAIVGRPTVVRRTEGRVEEGGATSPRLPTIGHGRPSRPARARCASRGWESRRVTRPAAIGRGTTNRGLRRGGIVHGAASRPIAPDLRASASRGPANRPAVHRAVIGPGAASRRRRLARGARGAESRAVRGRLAPRRASGETTILRRNRRPRW